MSTTASPVIPSSVTDANPGLTAFQAGAARNAHQHALVKFPEVKWAVERIILRIKKTRKSIVENLR